MTKAHSTFWPALTLFFMAPAVGELLSGSSPPAEFFNPFTLLVLVSLYGSGALLARELRLRWGAGWLSVFLLGAVYAIVEEGLMVKSFFDPNWVDLGILGIYGRWLGVNWVWALELTIYHAVFSIAIPILLVELIFPTVRHMSWLGKRAFLSVTLLLGIDVVFGFLFLTPYRPPLIPYVLSGLAAFLLLHLLRKSASSPSKSLSSASESVSRPIWFLLFGFAATVAFFFLNWIVPNLDVPPLLTMLAALLLIWQVYRQVRHMSGNGQWDDIHRLALASGALGFFILLAPMQQLDPNRLDNASGMNLVGAAALAFLLWLARQVKRRSASTPIQGNPTQEF